MTPVCEEVSKFAHQIWEYTLKPESLTSRLEKELCPSNVPIKVRTVNKEIFGIKKEISHIRSGDIKLQSIQGSITKSMFPLINLTEEIYKAKQAVKPIDLNHALARCMNAMVLMTNAFNVTDQFWRDRFKPVLPLELHGLTKQPEGISHDLLFGDDLDARLKEVKEKNQVSST